MASVYTHNNSLYIGINEIGKDGPESYGNLTVCLGDKLPEYHAYVDTNNMPELVGFIKRYELGEPTGDYASSGYCRYPLYKFDKDKLAEYCQEGLDTYEETLK